ncbi:MAG TPA: chromate efflux transporter [Rhizomicrobium sp.]|nr:chromate efflux transporter [Rhizomicrobium sp.]
MSGALEVFLVFLRLGATSFGGPVAHLGYFRKEFVERRRWLDEPAYAGIVGLCQFLPGPASSQVGMALGLMRAGLAGAIAAFVGFTAPSALLMTAFAYLMTSLGDVAQAPWIHGLKLAAVAVVAQALWSMARSLTPDVPRIGLALAAAAIALLLPSSVGQLCAIALGGVAGWLLLGSEGAPMPELSLPVGRTLSAVSLALFFLLLVALPFAARAGHALALVDGFYRTGALVFGGGHVVLPLLQKATAGWIDPAHFLAGYGAAQAVPGPLFSFAAFLGAAMKQQPNGWSGALLCLLSIYLPSFLLVIGALPAWHAAQRHPAMRAALKGVNAAVVGLLLAALYTPVWTSAIFGLADVAIAAAALALLFTGKVPSWAVVAFGAAAATAVSFA